jgi:hypothetical protein
MNEQNKSIESVPSAPKYSDIHQVKHLNSNHSIDTILFLFALLTSLKNLLKYIKKILKQRKCDPKLLLQIVGAILAIIKAIIDRFNRDDDDKDD